MKEKEMSTIKRSSSMKNLKNPAASFIVPFDFQSFDEPYSGLFGDHSIYAMNDPEKQKTARQSLHRYIFIIYHTIQHFGHHLTANELKMVQNACEQTLQWMWRGEIKSLEDYRLRIVQLTRICSPLMKRLFQAEQQSANINYQYRCMTKKN